MSLSSADPEFSVSSCPLPSKPLGPRKFPPEGGGRSRWCAALSSKPASSILLPDPPCPQATANTHEALPPGHKVPSFPSAHCLLGATATLPPRCPEGHAVPGECQGRRGGRGSALCRLPGTALAGSTRPRLPSSFQGGAEGEPQAAEVFPKAAGSQVSQTITRRQTVAQA